MDIVLLNNEAQIAAQELSCAFIGDGYNEKTMKTAIEMQSGFNYILRFNNAGKHLKLTSGQEQTGRHMGSRPLKVS